MPRGNGTGPTGMGPMTGKGTGYCAGYGMPGSGLRMGAGQMRGWRGGCGRGLRPGRMAYMDLFASPPSEDEKQILQRQADMFQSRLNEIRGRLDELEKPKS